MEELTIAERINHYMKQYGMNNSDLAKRIGVGQRTLIRYKENPDNMTYGTIKQICKVLNISVERLLEGR